MSTRFSLVSAVYNVARYLPEFFASLEQQSYGFEGIEVVLVDDGSTDDSLALAEAFAARHANVRVLSQENAGQGAARNAGIAVATGEWVTFVDPDDVLDEVYFAEVAALMDAPAAQEAEVFGAHTIMWDEANDRRTDTHPNAFRFSNGNAVVDLERHPNFVHGQAPLTFFRTEIIRREGLAFDDRLRTRFEDGKFVAEYLLALDRPVLGLVAEARYYYRRRADGSSSVQNARGDDRTYRTVAVHGYLPLVERAQARFDAVPKWLQTLIVYDVLWLMHVDARDHVATQTVDPAVLARFVDDLRSVVESFTTEQVVRFDLMKFPFWLRFALAFGVADHDATGPVTADIVDPDRGLLRLRYLYSGRRPEEHLRHAGHDIVAHHTKTVVRTIFGQDVVKERILWVTADAGVQLDLDGKPQPITDDGLSGPEYRVTGRILDEIHEKRVEATPPKFRVRERSMYRVLRSAAGRTLRWMRNAMRKSTLADLAVAIELRFPWHRARYYDAWALMDREWDANDSAEELYRWLRANRPELKLWFVLSKDSPDWARLKADGFKLVAYGSRSWRILVLMAAELISSHVDAPIINPFRKRYGRERWRFTFLQHGVIKGDLSEWLNQKDIQTFVTSTQDEYDYIAGEGPFKFSTREVRLTGLPRFDALLRKADAYPEKPRYILIAPTWRKSLSQTLAVRTQRYEKSSGFMESEFAQTWQRIVKSPELRAVADERDLRIVFMPHPNLQMYLDEFEVPDDVLIVRYGVDDVQEIVAGSAVMLTDYSSIAFNMAYLQRPVVYFQFDRDRYWLEHTERQGYFDYETHGFGPVETDPDEAVRRLGEVIDGEHPEYLERARRTFPVRDGRNSERVYRAIVNAGRRVPPAKAGKAAAPDHW
ncbi:bifunctional glycosyltransferase/CDP-glycerol:glycerophosphate glycerophosphotransferase [Agromyces archimandritae]|uniref:CDP-glycerol glycerophosphotransferase family protein n=1 Tax=Agromyces archimandritae TaxID=2781962 RepID=A0A975FN74_9MICO|nr:CDP-glycerol glycerophosphotransferase family protein [Agromyces archimandritae]QTX05260.1 CDP-glycerol glycerophosphotransferase family protein [Agromyces archimandritae]